MQPLDTDILIIGGGINGVGIARDAAGRGLSVVLCEQDDLANHTSSASSKLIHGGLRYLEQTEFKLVREALAEREILLKIAPHLVQPLEFVLPHDKHLRPTWMIRLGLLFYDYLSRRKTIPKARGVNLQTDPKGRILKDKFTKGFCYWDCRSDDARLVIANALDASQRGAKILTRTRCQSLRRQQHCWHAHLYDRHHQTDITVTAKVVVNAAGPWVAEVLQQIAKIPTHSDVRLIKGSHFTVPKLYDGEQAYILQNSDGRIVFTIPYHNDFTLIGTTDIVYHDQLNELTISPEETRYLCNTVNYYFSSAINPKKINWSYAGVRSLYDDRSHQAKNITREYHLELDHDKAPILSIFGGKITTYRSLAQQVLSKLRRFLPKMGPVWTAKQALPGGDLPEGSLAQFIADEQQRYPWLAQNILQRYSKSYGTLARVVLTNAKNLADLGQYFGAGLYEREVCYLMDQEWAQTSDDIIWRRSKLGLYLDQQQIEQLTHYLEH